MRDSRGREGSRAPFDSVTILFHWLTVGLMGFQLTTGFAMGAWPELTRPLPFVHRSGGAIIFVVTLSRLAWRRSFARFPPFPAWMPKALQWLAKKSEHLLYVLLALQPLTGIAVSVLRGRPFRILLLDVPALVPPNLDLWSLLQGFHRMGAYALLTLAGGHGMMALVHHYVLRDDVLVMMAPWLRRPHAACADDTAAVVAGRARLR